MSFSVLRLLLSITVLCSSLNTGAQNADNAEIAAIRKIYTDINAHKDLREVKLENEELTEEVPDGGASLMGYFLDKQLLKTVFWAGLSYGTFQVEYYYNKDSLVFVYVNESHFRQSGDSVDHSATELKFEGRFYFRGDALILSTIKGNGFRIGSTDAVSVLLPDSKIYRKFFYAKRE